MTTLNETAVAGSQPVQGRAYVTLPSLTVGRGFAALFVAVHHATLAWGGILTPIGNVGWLGVSFFYILSGFVLTWSFNPGRGIKTFFVHRVARIYPLHLVTLTISLLGFYFLNSPLAGYVGNIPGTIASIFMLHGWIPGHPDIRQAWNGVSWSLSVEFFFYIFAPFLIIVLKRLSTSHRLDIAVVLFSLHLFFGLWAVKSQNTWLIDFLQYHPLARLPEFIYGIVLASCMQDGWRLVCSRLTAIALFLPIVFYCFVWGRDLNAMVMVDLSVPAFVVWIARAATMNIAVPGFFPDRSLYNIGEASYSLYMIHAIILGLMAGAVRHYNLHLHAIVLILPFLVVSIICSLIVYKYFELPARKFILRVFHG